MTWVLEDEEQFERQSSRRMASPWQRNVSSQGGGWPEASGGGRRGGTEGGRQGGDGRGVAMGQVMRDEAGKRLLQAERSLCVWALF